MKAAAIDLGTNAFRCLIRDIDSNNNNEMKFRHVVGLGKFLDKNNRLNLPNKYYNALDNIFNIIHQNYVKKIYVVGTSVFRDSINKNEILLDFKKRYHQKLNIISPGIEAELTSLGVNSLFVNPESDKIIVDIGGGSTEIIFMSQQKIINFYSLDLGVVRLYKKFNEINIFSFEKIKQIKNFVKKIIQESNISLNKIVKYQIVFNSGTSTTLAAISKNLKNYDSKIINQANLSITETYRMLNMLANKTAKQRLLLNGIEKGREEVIVYGIIILTTIMEYFSKLQFLVSDKGVLEGIFEKYIEI
tara:strand:+ start:39157 stop:40065 length:909 start_codon:yes stop_codon:yes gene_type:complete